VPIITAALDGAQGGWAMDRRRLLKKAAVVSAGGAAIALQGGITGSGLALAKNIRYVTYHGAAFFPHHSDTAQWIYWDNGAIYGIQQRDGLTGFATRLELPDGATVVDVKVNLRFNSGDGPALLSLLGFDTSDGYQIVAQGQVSDPRPALIRTVTLDVTQTATIDNERLSYQLRWRPSYLEDRRRDRPDVPEQMLWGARIGFVGK
jgi:hypothetical protein